MGEKKKEKDRAQLQANIDPKLKKRFQIALIEDDTNYTEWLMVRINEYLKKRGK